MKDETKENAIIEIIGTTSKLSTRILPKFIPSNIYVSIKNPTIKSFNTYVIPIRSRVVIRKKVGNLHFTVKKFNKGQEIITVKLSTNTVNKTYVGFSGRTIPSANRVKTK
jgi:NurA-like 5'-3' nuclease